MGFIVLGVAAYFIWQFNLALEKDQDGKALIQICLGFFCLFLLGTIFL